MSLSPSPAGLETPSMLKLSKKAETDGGVILRRAVMCKSAEAPPSTPAQPLKLKSKCTLKMCERCNDVPAIWKLALAQPPAPVCSNCTVAEILLTLSLSWELFWIACSAREFIFVCAKAAIPVGVGSIPEYALTRTGSKGSSSWIVPWPSSHTTPFSKAANEVPSCACLISVEGQP